MHQVTGYEREGYDVQATNVDDTCLTPRISRFSSTGLDWSVQSKQVGVQGWFERVSPSRVVWPNSVKVRNGRGAILGPGKARGSWVGNPREVSRGWLRGESQEMF